MSAKIAARDTQNADGQSYDFFPENRFFDEEECLNELEQSSSYHELLSIVSSVTLENPVSSSLFKGKYQVFIIENLLPWQKPIGAYFSLSYVICGVKPKKILEHKIASPEVFSGELGNPLPVLFESFRQSSEDNYSMSLISILNGKYDLYPLPESVGRKLLFLCSSFENVLKKPFVAICHEKKANSFILSGTMLQEKSLQLRVISLGTVSTSEKLPWISDLKEMHLEGFEPLMLSGLPIKESVSAVYYFLSFNSEDNSTLIPLKNSNISMECTWSDVHSVLEPLTSNSTCIAKLKAVAGDNETGAFQKYKDVKHIKNLQECLEYGLITWSNSNDSAFVLKKLKDLINSEKNSIYRKECPPVSKIDMDHFDNVILDERLNLDFPDKLWLVIRDCTSSEQLKDAFEMVYKAMKYLFVIPPFVSRKNMSTISTDIRSMLEKPVNCPNLDAAEALKLLLEIGIEKLRKDYTQIFLGLELVSHDIFSYFLQPNLLSREAVNRLEKLHCVLELIIICKKQLTLPKNILSEFARSALKHYTLVPDVDLNHVFNFQIPAIYARPLLNQMRPIVWEISLVSSDKDFKKQSIHRFVTTPTHEHIYAPENYHPKLMLSKASYVYHTATLIDKVNQG